MPRKPTNPLDYIGRAACTFGNRPALTWGWTQMLYGRRVSWGADGYRLDMVWDSPLGDRRIALPKSTGDSPFPPDITYTLEKLTSNEYYVAIDTGPLLAATKALRRQNALTGWLRVHSEGLVVIGDDITAIALPCLTNAPHETMRFFNTHYLADTLVSEAASVSLYFSPESSAIYVQNYAAGEEMPFCAVVMGMRAYTKPGEGDRYYRRILDALDTPAYPSPFGKRWPLQAPSHA